MAKPTGQHRGGPGRHRGGWTVRAPHAAPVRYPTRKQARNVARQVRGARAASSGCLLTLLLLPWFATVALVRRGGRGRHRGK